MVLNVLFLLSHEQKIKAKSKEVVVTRAEMVKHVLMRIFYE